MIKESRITRMKKKLTGLLLVTSFILTGPVRAMACDPGCNMHGPRIQKTGHCHSDEMAKSQEPENPSVLATGKRSSVLSRTCDCPQMCGSIEISQSVVIETDSKKRSDYTYLDQPEITHSGTPFSPALAYRIPFQIGPPPMPALPLYLRVRHLLN